ncbi:MAG: hypothetical protein KIT69_17735 [Propionibacteriaceae bacterium]|nr:hypothetical protein [Propionibacteriaceae bacterium]
MTQYPLEYPVALAAVSDPHADSSMLSAIAQQFPAMRPKVAAHPNAGPELLAWLGGLDVVAIEAALQARGGHSQPPAAPARPRRLAGESGR